MFHSFPSTINGTQCQCHIYTILTFEIIYYLFVNSIWSEFMVNARMFEHVSIFNLSFFHSLLVRFCLFSSSSLGFFCVSCPFLPLVCHVPNLSFPSSMQFMLPSLLLHSFILFAEWETHFLFLFPLLPSPSLFSVPATLILSCFHSSSITKNDYMIQGLPINFHHWMQHRISNRWSEVSTRKQASLSAQFKRIEMT